MPDEQQLAMWDEATLWANVQARVFPGFLVSFLFSFVFQPEGLFCFLFLFSSLFLVFP